MTLTHRPATPEDHALILTLMEEFYAEDRLEFHPARAGAAVSRLLAQPELGSILLLSDEAVPGATGFLVLIHGFTLEHGGAYLLLDELYLQPALRGRGFGKEALRLAETYARANDLPVLRLEVNHHNPAAKALYAKSGFRDEERDLMFRPIL